MTAKKLVILAVACTALALGACRREEEHESMKLGMTQSQAR